MVGDHEQGLQAQAQPLALLGSGDHLEGLAGTHHMSKQCVAAVEDVGNGVDLMGPEGDLRVHADKVQMASVILTGPDRVELVVIQPRQPLTPVGIIPDPVGKGLLDEILLTLGDGGFLLVQDGDTLAAFRFHIIEDAHILQVQRLLNDLVGVDPTGAVGIVGIDADSVQRLALNVPFAGVLGVVDMDVPAHVDGRTQKLEHELLHHSGRKPDGTQANGDLTGGQIHRLYCFQRLHIGAVGFRQLLGVFPCDSQLLPDIAGEILVCREILGFGAVIGVEGVAEDHAGEVRNDLLLALAGQLCHVGNVDLRFLSQ